MRREDFNTAHSVLDSAIIVGAGKYGYLVTLLDDAGAPVAGVTISGISSNTGGACVTDAGGQTLGVSTAQSVTLSAASPFLNLQNVSRTVTSTGIITQVTLTFPRAASNEATLTSSRSFRFSSAVVSVDWTAVGGGGAGGRGGQTGSNYAGAYGGGGGGGGYVSTVLQSIPQAEKLYTASVGSGAGVGGTEGGTSRVSVDGTDIVSARGGACAQNYTRGTGNGNGGQGWWYNGQSASGGSSGSGYIFNDAAKGLAGGGGGGGGTGSESVMGGGGPNGARGVGQRMESTGSSNNVYPIHATSPGIGGGGGGGLYNLSTWFTVTSNPTSGGTGAVYIRWRYKS